MIAIATVTGWILVITAVITGLILDLVGLFGNWIILAAIALSWTVTRFTHWNGWIIAILLLLAILGEVFESLASGFGAARFGGGRGAIISSFLAGMAGAVIGTPWFPIIGTLIGACLGAFLGAVAHELLLMRRQFHEAAWTGIGALIGRIAGTFAKFFIGMTMSLLAIFTF